MTATPLVVLDTNVVLDCFLFGDPAAQIIATAVRSRRWQWIVTPDMSKELSEVVDRPSLARWHTNRDATLAAMDELGELIEPPTCAPSVGLMCNDPDDQKFIDLALTRRGSYLFTRDNAVLRLARRARGPGVLILRPMDWPAHEAAWSQVPTA